MDNYGLNFVICFLPTLSKYDNRFLLTIVSIVLYY